MTVSTLESLPLETIACPLCGSEASSPVVSTPDRTCGLPGLFHVVRCQSCGHAYLNPRPTREALALCYPAGYSPHQFSPVNSDRQPAPKPVWVRCLDWIPGAKTLYHWLRETHSNWTPARPHAEARALDVGCATGQFLLSLREKGWQVAGVELTPAAVQVAKAAGLDVTEGVLEDAAFPDHSFDAVFAWMVLEHVPAPLETLAEIRRLVRDEGYFVFSVPNFGSWEPKIFGRCWIAYELPRHLQHYTPRILKRILSQSGFRVERIVHQSNSLNVIASTGVCLQTVPGFRRLGTRLANWFVTDPPFAVTMLCAWPAKLLAALRQGGRITVIARPITGFSSTKSPP